MTQQSDIEQPYGELVKKPVQAKLHSVSQSESNLECEKFIKVRLLGGEVRVLLRENVIGCCHCTTHRGSLTKMLLYKHKCLEKKCRYLERYKDRSFWAEYRKQKQPAKSEACKLRAEKKAQKRAEGSLLCGLRDSFQRYADAVGAEILVVRVEPVNRHTYRAFYVSDNPFPDWNMLSAFVEAVERVYRAHRVSLRRIRDLDGHLVTREEYYARKR